MKLATFAKRNSPGAPRLGVVREGGLIDLEKTAAALGCALPAKDMISALGSRTLEAVDRLATEGEKRGFFVQADSVVFLPPVSNPSKFFCVGKNSRQHRQELVANDMLKEMPSEPTGFVKLVQTMVGDDVEVLRPEGITTLDYEPELVLVVGRHAHRVKKGEGRSYIAGITVFNDLTAREIQKREVASGTRFWTAKNMPGFAPIGPYVVTLDEVKDPFDLWVTCHVNGELRLRENTSQYIYQIEEVLEHFTRYMPFEPGDLIAMGAPKGVAMGQPNAAELYLKPGDKMEIGLEGLMTLRTTIAGG
ncbi:fumarylacetoacetate hydrolase family protein [Bradyrhizobium sp. URHD0069]|uniref:fumarylacetoacetate hydrolase family protein n=1 Tax=Bradyrhizobium sp. URHD0069 TaxID=1380355 RepID=UPI00049665B4|nr:fumarylacetoacetate hydrolase family protein [Bradyrhizobium sp. URHD0069]